MAELLSGLPSEVIQAASRVCLLVLDVDGVLTDGQVIYSGDELETKSFNIKDGLGVKLLQQAGIEVAIITGRTSAMLMRRARELGIASVIQGREDKIRALSELLEEKSLDFSQVAYIGDDLPDLAAIRQAGLGVTVADAYPLVAEHANYQTRAAGGRGAVRELADLILQAQGKYQALVSSYL